MIPRTIHRIWIGGAEPDWTAPFRSTWARPGWHIEDWGEEQIQDLMPLYNQDLYDKAGDIAPNNVGQLRSDLLRYEILYKFGGVYVDHDLECLKPIDSLIEGLSCFLSWEVENEWATNCFMGCAPGHPFLAHLILGVADQVRITNGKNYRPNRITGPHYITRKYWDDIRAIEVLPQELVFPYSWSEIGGNGPGGDWGEAFTVHHWHNMRREKDVPVA